MGLTATPQNPTSETNQDSCPGWLPPVSLDLVSPQEGLSPGSLTPRFKCFRAVNILPISFLCFPFGIRFIELRCKTIHQLEEFIDKVLKHIAKKPVLTMIWPNGPIFMMFWNCSYMSRKLKTPKINNIINNISSQFYHPFDDEKNEWVIKSGNTFLLEII